MLKGHLIKRYGGLRCFSVNDGNSRNTCIYAFVLLLAESNAKLSLPIVPIGVVGKLLWDKVETAAYIQGSVESDHLFHWSFALHCKNSDKTKRKTKIISPTIVLPLTWQNKEYCERFLKFACMLFRLSLWRRQMFYLLSLSNSHYRIT